MSEECDCFSRKRKRKLRMLHDVTSNNASNIEKQDSNYLTPLHIAAKYGEVECMQVLLERGANPNRQSPSGTPVHLAAANGEIKCLELLIKYGGIILVRNKAGLTPLQVAERKNQEEVIRFIATTAQLLPTKGSAMDITNEMAEDQTFDNDGDDDVDEKGSNCEDIDHTSNYVSIPIPEVSLSDLELNENCKYAIGPKTLSIMGKLNKRTMLVKTYQKSSSELEIHELFKTEMETLRCLYHPNISLLLAVCRGAKTLGQYLIFEPLEHYYLHRLLYEEKLQLLEDFILNIAHDVADAMQYVHNMGFLHCYLGSQSVVVTRDYTAKICNFEYSLREDRGPVSLSHCCLLHGWMAPEQIMGHPMDKPGDVFGFGILIWECLTLKRSRQLFSLEQLSVIGNDLHSRMLTKTEGKRNLKLLIKNCTDVAAERPTFHQVFAWLDGLLHYRLVNVAPVSMDKDEQLPNLFTIKNTK